MHKPNLIRHPAFLIRVPTSEGKKRVSYQHVSIPRFIMRSSYGIQCILIIFHSHYPLLSYFYCQEAFVFVEGSLLSLFLLIH